MIKTILGTNENGKDGATGKERERKRKNRLFTAERFELEAQVDPH